MKIFQIIHQYIVYSALLVVALAGCGGGDGGGTQPSAGSEMAVTTSSRSKTEFVLLANKICERDDAKRSIEIGEYLKSHQDEGSTTLADILAAFRAVVATKIPIRIEEIRALGAPAGDEQRIEAFLVSLQRIVDAPERLKSVKRAVRRSADLSHSYGLHKCAYIL